VHLPRLGAEADAVQRLDPGKVLPMPSKRSAAALISTTRSWSVLPGSWRG
jgi:hypothetical protein